MTQKPALLCALAAVLTPFGAQALGLGDIKLNSALNEPLDAEIELISATPDELRNLSAKVAPRDTFGQYGLDYPEFLSGLAFAVEQGAGGVYILRVTSRRPIPEPFLTFLVEADWDRGRLLREYTVLLDPPVFMPGEQQAAPAAAPPTTSTAPAATSGSVIRPAPAVRPEPAPTPRPQPAYTSSSQAQSEYGPVRRNETLSEIALRVRPDTAITINQMMIAIYGANPEAFQGNINLLRQGAVLRIPSAAQVRGVSSGEAVAQVRRHNQDWRSARPGDGAAASAAGAAATPEAPARLRLVSPEAGGADSSSAGGAASAAALEATRERLADAEAQAGALRGELESARAELEETRRLLELKDSELAALQKNLADRAEAAAETAAGAVQELPADEAPVTDPGAEPGEVADVAEATPAEVAAELPEPEAPAAPVAAEPQDSRGFLATVGGIFSGLGNWLWVILLGLVALGAAAVMALRGRSAAAPEDWEAELTAAAAATPVEDDTRIRPATDTERMAETAPKTTDETGTFKPVDFSADEATVREAPSETAEYPFEDTVAGDEAMKLDQSDPLAEADFHMAYGLYDQAADLVRKASEREPDRRDLQHKLLEIFFVWGNKSAFLDGARKLRESMGPTPDAEWDKIVIMGKQICPDDALFSGDAGATMAAGAIDLDLMSGGQETDFDMGASDEFTSESAEMDLDLGEALSGGAPMGGTEIQAMPGSDDDDNIIDFDLGLGGDADDSGPDQDRIAAVRDRMESGALTSEETAEMDLESLGLDLDIGETGVQDFIETTETRVSADASGSDEDTQAEELDVDELLGDFDDFTATGGEGDDSPDLDETQQRLAPDFSKDIDTEVDLDLGAAPATAQADDETEGELITLDGLDDGDDDSHFSAEIETLSGESIDMDFEDFAGTTGVGPNDETVLADIPQFRDEAQSDEFADVFGANDETALMDTGGTAKVTALDTASTQMLGPDDATQEMSEVDLDVGDTVDDGDGQPTTMRVPAAELALPESEEEGEMNEVGTKLDLARAYMDMGDPDGARGILEEVLEEGDDGQQQDARELLASLG